MIPNNSINSGGITVSFVKPYDFALSLHAVRSFLPAVSEKDPKLRLAARVSDIPTLIEISHNKGTKSQLKAFSHPEVATDDVRSIAEWVLFAELDLKPFYHIVAANKKLGPIMQKLHGLKPMRPVSLFEMAVIAITEQQISLAAAYQIRDRVIQKFGEPVDNLWVFPSPQDLSAASLEELRSCGLSRQKAEYIHSLAAQISSGNLDLDSLKSMDTDQAREVIMSWRGFGRWSADYILVRGLARPDCVPADDIGIRDVVGWYLGRGQRVNAQEVAEILEPFRPYRGLLAFYLLAYHRLEKTAGVFIGPPE